MPRGTVSGTDTGAFEIPHAAGPTLQVVDPVIPNAAPTGLGNGGVWDSGLILADGFRSIAVGVISTQAGSVALQRYLDMTGAIPIDGGVTASLVGGVPLVVSAGQDNLPFTTFRVTITNGATPCTLSQVSFVLNAT